LGIVLRKCFFRYLFANKPDRVIFGKNIDIFNPKNIRIGRNCLTGDNCLLDLKQGRSITIGDKVIIRRETILRCGLGSIEIGDNTAVGSYTHIGAIGTRVKIGKHALIAAYVYPMGGGGYDLNRFDGPLNKQILVGKGIFIKDDFWLLGGVCVTDGNSIGTGTVVGAGSVVTKHLPSYAVASGIPARVVRRRFDREKE
jgi:acetyltransferase-like isoleucine patch superfamily enzyme